MKIFNKKYNVIIIGADGMLGHDVLELMLAQQKLEKSCIGIVTPLTIKDIDITLPYALSDFINRNVVNPPIKYDYVINCAAITDTKMIETGIGYRNYAYDVNALGPMRLASACAYYGVKLIHISTDYVYSQLSTKGRLPFHTDYSIVDAFHENNADEFPVNIYGMQKLLGEKFIKEKMKKKNYAILRTSWLYGNYNQKSFVHKVLKNIVKKYNDDIKSGTSMPDPFEFEMTQNELSIPTRTESLAKMILNVIKYKLYGTFAATGLTSSGLMSGGGRYAVSRKEWTEEIVKIFDPLKQEIRIVGVDRDTLAPKYSRMYNSNFTDSKYKKLYDGLMFDWKQELCWFLSNNADSIKEYIDA